MHNPVKPLSKITIKQHTYALVFNFEAIATAEDITGRSLLTGLSNKDAIKPSINLVRAMFFACALAEQPDITFEAAKTLITPKNITEVWVQVMQAWLNGLAEPEEADEDADPNQAQS